MNDTKNALSQLLAQFQPEITDEQVETALGKFGRVENNGGFWQLYPTDAQKDEEFCNQTGFAQSEKKLGIYNVLPHELNRIQAILR